MRPRAQGGFTLVELMVVIVLIGLLAGAVGVGVFGILKKGKNVIAKDQIGAFKQALELFYIDNSRYPETLEELTVPNEKHGNETYMEKIPLDPWGQNYEYDPRGGTTKDYLILSRGEKPEDPLDDITSEPEVQN